MDTGTDTTLTASVLLQLARRARKAENPAVLGFVAVNESRQLLDFRQSALWLHDKGVVAVSGLPDVEPDAPYIQWLAQLGQALALYRDSEPASPSPAIVLDAHALPENLPATVGADWDDWWPAQAFALPLVDGAGKSLGFWFLARTEAWSESEIAIAQELAEIYAHAWRTFLPGTTWRERLRKWRGNGRRQTKIAVAIALVLLFPVHLSVMAPAEVVPKDAFAVRAPLEGAVDSLHVRPYQLVKENDPLFDLDTTGLRTRLSMARKAYEAAAEEYRQSAQLAVNDDEKGRLDISQRKGRMEEKAAELAYSEQLLDRVQVKAPRSGIAVYADASDWIGKAVTIGERIMLIADPSRVEVVIRLAAADAIAFDTEIPITVYLSNAKQFSHTAHIRYVAYKAEAMPDGVVAYKIKADFAAADDLPRLGLTGTARLYGARVPFIYYLLRRPIAAVRQKVGW